MHPALEAVCIKVPCPVCEGSGRVLTTGFSEPKQPVEKSCHACKGRGHFLDLEATVEELAGLGKNKIVEEYYVIFNYKRKVLWRWPDGHIMQFANAEKAQTALSTLTRFDQVDDNWNVMKCVTTHILYPI